MFIQTQETPNPNSIKFIPVGREILKNNTVNLVKDDNLQKYPIAQALFNINGVTGVFLSESFITVTKSQAADWSTLKTLVLTEFMDFFVSDTLPVMLDLDKTEKNISNIDDSEIVKQIKEIIEEKVRPAVAQDGGDIIYHDFVDGVVQLELRGACSGCPSSTVTLKNGIESMLKHYIPEVKSVESI